MSGWKCAGKWKRSMAETEMVSGMYMLLILIVLLSVQLQLDIVRVSSAFAEDALAASNLASAVIDLEEYGKTHVIHIAMPEAAYQLYREAIRSNMQLNEQWESRNQNMISGQVEVEEYAIYNVKGQDVWIYTFGQDGCHEQMVQDGLGRIQTPDGTVVEATSIYSRISYPVRGIFGLEAMAVKHKTVDVISNLFDAEE